MERYLDSSASRFPQEYQVIRSAKRRKTISATFQNGTLVLRVPRGMAKHEEAEWAHKMRERLEKRRRRVSAENPALKVRAEELNRAYFGGKLSYHISWTENQKSRWGSCTPLTGEIRICQDLARMPGFVLDYVIVHELAHLLVPDHSQEFWDLVERFPKTERARGYLHGYSHGRGQVGDEELC